MDVAIVKNYFITVPLESVWKALTDAKTIEKWGAGPAKMSDEGGADFELWGGDIHGTNADSNNKDWLLQEWYAGSWKEPSMVEFKLTEKNGGTVLTLTHTGVPDSELKEIDEGWDKYYLGPMKEYLEAK